MSAAAEEAGVTPRTLARWLADDPIFLSEYRAARRRVTEEAIGAVQASMTDAVATLHDALEDKSPHVRLKAATAILNYAFEAFDADLLERVEALEREVGG
jgi:hypothetical protein